MLSRLTHSTVARRGVVLMLALLWLVPSATGEGGVRLADGSQAPPHPFDLTIAAAEDGPDELRELYRHLLGLSGAVEEVAAVVSERLDRLTLEVN